MTGSIGSAMRTYLEVARATYGNPGAPKPGPSQVPAGVARMPLDAPVPRAWAERRVNLVYWRSEPARGGHHSSWEVPEIFADDLRTFVGELAARRDPANGG